MYSHKGRIVVYGSYRNPLETVRRIPKKMLETDGKHQKKSIINP
jgi:hypothetical protein